MDIRYVAGLFDGEGSVMLLSPNKGKFRCPVVSISNNYLELLNPLPDIFGGHVSTKSPRSSKHNISYDWKVINNKAINFLSQVLPYLRHPEKIRRAELILNRYKLVTQRNGKYNTEQLKAKLQFESEFYPS